MFSFCILSFKKIKYIANFFIAKRRFRRGCCEQWPKLCQNGAATLTSDQMIALLQSGKAVFGVSVGSLWHQIHDALETEDYVDLQSSSANVGSAGSGRVAGRPIDELTAMRMRRKIAAQRAAREAA